MTPLAAGILRTLVLCGGLVAGSILAAIVYRVPRGMSVLTREAHCPKCLHPLAVTDLLPVVSFLFHRGRCPYCSAVVSWIYPAVEISAGVLTLVLFMRYGPGWAFAAYCLLCYLAIALAAIDLEHHLLPNLLTISGIILGLVVNTAWYLAGGAAIPVKPSSTWEALWPGSFVDPGVWGAYEVLAPHFSPVHAVLGIIVGGGVLWLVAWLSRGGMGGGDVKYLAAIGSFIGPGAALTVLVAASFIGAVVGLTLMAAGRMSRRQPIPFGPFLSLAVVGIALIG
ncbi:MAG TPA: prepilin peptidase [Firmicutes bacterium]|nr:prepilin peptidase [Bacillota bacterium]